MAAEVTVVFMDPRGSADDSTEEYWRAKFELSLDVEVIDIEVEEC